MSELIVSKVEDAASEELETISDEEVELHIEDASGMVLGALEGYYGGVSALQVTNPYASKPFALPTNQSKVKLLKVGVSSTAVTEVWTLKMAPPADSTEYIRWTIEGSVSGEQGSGAILVTNPVDFNSTNEAIQILTTYWQRNDDVSKEGDKIRFATFKVKPIIAFITAMLAAGTLLDAKLSEVSPNSSSIGKRLTDRAFEWLEKLANPEKSGVTLASVPTVDFTLIMISMNPSDSLGEDATKYESISEERERLDIMGFDS